MGLAVRRRSHAQPVVERGIVRIEVRVQEEGLEGELSRFTGTPFKDQMGNAPGDNGFRVPV